MIWLLNLVLVLALSSNPAFAKSKSKKSGKKSKDKVYLTKIGTCAPRASADGRPAAEGRNIQLIKQWDLPARTSTKGFKEKYAQEKNQTAIYNSLDTLVKQNKIQLIVAEGCEGEINSEFKETFNGWDLASLGHEVGRKNYAKIITSVPMKIKAKHGDKVRVVCGDNLAKIKEGNLRLSNLRGWTGYFSKFKELENDPEQLKLFTDAAAAQLKISPKTPIKDLSEKVQAEIKREVEALNTSIAERDTSFVKLLQQEAYQAAAVVVGGIHIADLKLQLENAGMNCDVFEPPGYAHEEEALIREFQNMIKK